MSEKNTFIAYMTSGGVTREYAEIISEALKEKGYKTTLLDINKNPRPDTTQYDSMIIGTGVRAGRVYKKALNFMKNRFDEKPVAIYLSSSEAGTPESYQDAVDKYMNPIKADNPHLNIVAIEGFGGRIKIFGKTVSDLTTPDKVKEWANSLTEKL